MDSTQIKKLSFLQILVVITGISESLSVIAIAPLMTAITNPKSLFSNPLLIHIIKILDLNDSDKFILVYGIVFLIFLFFSNLLSILTIWLLSVFAAQFGGILSNRLYQLYLSMNYSSFLTLGSSYITKQISSEVSRLTDNVLQPLVQINARIVSAILICLLLFIYNPFAALLSIVIFSIAYLLIYFFVKQKLKLNGTNLSKINQSRFKYISEGFGAFREIKSFGISKVFNNRFSESSKEFASAYSTLNTIYNAPRYIIEFFVFSTLVFLIFRFNGGNNVELLSVISVFGLAAIKLLPIFQQVFSCFAQIRGHKNALDLIYFDIINSTYVSDISDDNLVFDKTENCKGVNNFSHLLKLDNISYRYSNGVSVLNNISVNFNKGELIAIIGKSGAGKSTLSDIITGLILPDEGNLFFKDIIINNFNLSLLRESISLVPQSAFVVQGNFIENITFSGFDNYDEFKIWDIIKQVGLLDFVNKLDDGLYTVIGDGFLILSGGQRQKLAIARALYKESEIIFFDEPTSSLDPESKTEITKLINSLVPLRTVINISHDLSTIIGYDKVILMDSGKIIQVGSYKELSETTDLFSKIMAV
jgi:ABC-type multidrug transport system fused ATPase/permease subunit